LIYKYDESKASEYTSESNTSTEEKKPKEFSEEITGKNDENLIESEIPVLNLRKACSLGRIL